MTTRIHSIIEEGARTHSISRITSTEKEIIATLYEAETGENLNLYCGGCIVGACITLFNSKTLQRYEKQGKK